METHDDASTRLGASTTDPALESLGPLLICLDHVGLAVADLDAAIDLHTRVLGGTLLHREENPDQGVAEAMIGIGGSPDGAVAAQVQLIAPLDETSTIAKFLDRKGPGLQQLAYRVTDVEAAAERLRAAGVRLLYDTPRPGTAGSKINFCHPKDTGGVLLELVEPAR